MRNRIVIYLVLGCIVLTAATTVPADQQKRSNETPPDGGVRDAMNRLWRSHVSVPAEKKSGVKLDRAVRALKTIRIEQSDKPVETKKVAGKQQRPARAEKPSAPPTRHPNQISPEMLARIRKLPKESIPDPAGLAEVLRLGGHHDVAARFYDMAADIATDEDKKAWLLFRSANCLRRSDGAAALQRYRKLLAECPNSLWGPLGKAQAQTIEWYQKNNVADLLDKTKKEALK